LHTLYALWAKLGLMMRIFAILAIGSVCAVTGCQSASYTQYMPGPPLEYAEAKCNILAPGVDQGYFAFGSPGYVAGAAIGNALGNALAEQQFKKNCMAMQGWRQDPPGTKKAVSPMAVSRQAVNHQPLSQVRTGTSLGIPTQVVAAQ
jgi:hypothetical protein